MTKRLKFTKQAIEKLVTEPGAERTYYYDLVTPALCVSVARGGTKSFFIYRRIQGKPKRYRIGQFPEMTVEQARKRAAEANLKVIEGQDPQAEKQAKRAQPTLGDAFELWMTYAKAHKRTWRQDDDQFERQLSHWKSQRLSDLRRAEIVSWHASLGEEKGKYSANRALALLRSIYNHAINNLELSIVNPATSVRMFREESRDRRLSPDELPAFFRALADEPNHDIKDYVFLALFTGARRSNLLSMRWDEISMEQKLWVIPASKSKNGLAMPVPLADPALEILHRRLAAREQDNPFVFAGRGESGHLEDPKSGWKRICKNAGITNLRIHDLRRTLASFQIDGGASLEVVGKTLGHQSAETTRIYARMALDPVRASVEQATASMLLAANQRDEVKQHGGKADD